MFALFVMIILFFTVQSSSADIYRYVSDEGTVCFTNASLGTKGEIVVKEKKSLSKARQQAKLNQAVNRASKDAFHMVAEEKARQHSIDPKLVKAVIKAESNWNPSAVSSKGARGLMQLMPSTASDMGVSNLFNPEENIEGGVRYLKYLIDKFNGNLTLALAAYNAGPKVVERINDIPSIPETRQYVARVINDYSGGIMMPYGSGMTNSYGKANEPKIKKVILGDGTILFTNSPQYSTGRHFSK
jgi:soluble lytic murein transglycosylase-like protein